MKKIEEIFVKYGVNLDLIDVLECEGKISLGELDNLKIIDEINKNTDLTACYSNDFDGGVILEK